MAENFSWTCSRLIDGTNLHGERTTSLWLSSLLSCDWVLLQKMGFVTSRWSSQFGFDNRNICLSLTQWVMMEEKMKDQDCYNDSMMDMTSLLHSKMTWCDELTDKQSRPTITIDVRMWPSHFGLRKIRALTWLALKPRIDWLGLQYFDSNIFLKLTHSHGLWLAHTRCGASCARTQSTMGHFLFLNNHSGYVWSLLCQERVTEYSICKGDMIERNDIRGILTGTYFASFRIINLLQAIIMGHFIFLDYYSGQL